MMMTKKTNYQTHVGHTYRPTKFSNTQQKLKLGLVASYDIRPGNEVGLFW